jgi:multicomponent Na+:H+ antiporter subunit D
MIGVPPLAGFVSKWYLGLGALEAGMPWVLAVLAASSLLAAAYFLPILQRAWFRPPPREWPAEHLPARGGWETAPLLLIPALATAAATLAAGLFAGASFSPLDWAKLVAAREYLTWVP